MNLTRAAYAFVEAGGYHDGVDGVRWDGYLDRTLDQLSWWAKAAARERDDGADRPGAFVVSPAERNAPG